MNVCPYHITKRDYCMDLDEHTRNEASDGRWCINSDRNKPSAEKFKFKTDLAQPEPK